MQYQIDINVSPSPKGEAKEAKPVKYSQCSITCPHTGTLPGDYNRRLGLSFPHAVCLDDPVWHHSKALYPQAMDLREGDFLATCRLAPFRF